MPDLRRRLRSVDLPGREDVTARSAFRFGSMAVFFLLATAFLIVSITADILLLGILAGVIFSQFLYVVLPMQEIRGRAKRFYTGEAGEEAYESLEDRGGGLR